MAPTRWGDVYRIEDGIAMLRAALVQFQKGGAVRTSARVRLALSSAAGALRAAEGRRARAERKLEAERGAAVQS